MTLQLVDALVRLGATHLLGIPDNDSAPLFDAAAADDRIALLTVTREGEAFAVASGLWLGGASPVVAIQNTGLLESGDSLRGTAVRMGAPFVCLIGYRGHGKMQRAGVEALVEAPPPPALQRADVDSAALITEPTLRAWGVPYRVVSPEHLLTELPRAWQRALQCNAPVALLVTGPLEGR